MKASELFTHKTEGKPVQRLVELRRVSKKYIIMPQFQKALQIPQDDVA